MQVIAFLVKRIKKSDDNPPENSRFSIGHERATGYVISEDIELFTAFTRPRTPLDWKKMALIVFNNGLPGH